MRLDSMLTVLPIAFGVLFSSAAMADESTQSAGAEALASDDGDIDDGPALGPEPSREYTERVNRAARGVGIGYANGLWGSGFGQSLRVDIPFGYDVGQFFGLRVHGVFAHGPSTAPRYDPVVFGGGEIFGRSPVVQGLVRLYGGGGLFVGGRPLDRPGDRFGVSGGGHMGIELFAQPSVSTIVEIGGQGPVHADGVDAGASIMGGLVFYVGGG